MWPRTPLPFALLVCPVLEVPAGAQPCFPLVCKGPSSLQPPEHWAEDVLQHLGGAEGGSSILLVSISKQTPM